MPTENAFSAPLAGRTSNAVSVPKFPRFVLDSSRSYANWFWVIGSVRYVSFSSAVEYARGRFPHKRKKDRTGRDKPLVVPLANLYNAPSNAKRTTAQHSRNPSDESPRKTRERTKKESLWIFAPFCGHY
jgi:hypothetical protein